MNFLAHIYLSGSNKRVQIGNFMGDGIRGKEYLHYHQDIQLGVLLHRSIDSFTDFHPVFRQSKHRLVAKYNHFSGIITDMFYDHFLANEWDIYHHQPLHEFTTDFYTALENHQSELNLKTKGMMPYLLKQNWLERYASVTDLQQILKQMDNRFAYPSKMNESVDELQKYYDDFKNEFHLFFIDLKEHASKEKQRIQLELIK